MFQSNSSVESEVLVLKPEASKASSKALGLKPESMSLKLEALMLRSESLMLSLVWKGSMKYEAEKCMRKEAILQWARVYVRRCGGGWERRSFSLTVLTHHTNDDNDWSSITDAVPCEVDASR